MSELPITGGEDAFPMPSTERTAALLKLGFGLELITGLFWVIPMLTSERGSLGYLVYWGPSLLLNSAIVLASLIPFVKRADLRSLALRNLLAPFVILIAPILVRSLAGGAPFPELEADGFAPLYGALAASLVGLVVFPNPVANALPNVLWSHPRLHRVIAIALAVLIVLNLLCWLLSLAGFMAGEARVVDKDLGKEVAMVMLLGSALLGISSQAIGFATLLWSYIALRQRIDPTQQRLRVIALVESLVLCAVGTAGLVAAVAIIGGLMVHHA